MDSNSTVYPIVLVNKKIYQKVIQITDNIILRKLEKTEKLKLFGDSTITYEYYDDLPYKNLIRHRGGSFLDKNAGAFPASAIFSLGQATDYLKDLLTAGYAIEIKSSANINADVSRINLALKMLELNSSGIYLGLMNNGYCTDEVFQCSGPFGYLHITKKKILALTSIIDKINRLDGEKHFKIMASLFYLSLSGEKRPLVYRFLQMVIILEMLYLKDDKELSFKLALYSAKIMHKYCGLSFNEVFNQVKEIYDIRCDIIHSGNITSVNKQVFFNVSELVRKSLNLYLIDKQVFSKKRLKDSVFY